MSEGCTHDCSTCGESCSERKAEDMKLRQNDYSNIKKVIAVVSGKGGVGKSLVTSLLASASQARGFETAVMDADVTGPSIPKAFGIHERAMGSDEGMFPVESKTGIKGGRSRSMARTRHFGRYKSVLAGGSLGRR